MRRRRAEPRILSAMSIRSCHMIMQIIRLLVLRFFFQLAMPCFGTAFALQLEEALASETRRSAAAGDIMQTFIRRHAAAVEIDDADDVGGAMSAASNVFISSVFEADRNFHAWLSNVKNRTSSHHLARPGIFISSDTSSAGRVTRGEGSEESSLLKAVNRRSHRPHHKKKKSRVHDVLVVSQDESGNFTTIQAAIDSIPHTNKRRVEIRIEEGVYREKIVIPERKGHITTKGRSHNRTIIAWNATAGDLDAQGHPLHTMHSATVAINSDHFIAKNITFTEVELHADPDWGIPGSITAQKRNDPTSKTGFSFVRCKIRGAGMVYLGRAWGNDSRVVFADSFMSDIVMPSGWNDWGIYAREK